MNEQQRIQAELEQCEFRIAYATHQLAERAWLYASGDYVPAIKILREWTGLSLTDAVTAIKETRLKGGAYNPGWSKRQ